MRFFALFLAVAAGVSSQTAAAQPVVSSDGVVNAASYNIPEFPNYGIARGSLFVVFGTSLGPVALVQADHYPLPDSQGLAGTSVQIRSGDYSGYALMVYTSAEQVAAILPSAVPEGAAQLTVSYNGLTSGPVSVPVVRSTFGIFAANESGWGQAVVQNFASPTEMPANTVLSSAIPGQTLILWGTGLGPVTGDEAQGPLAGALPYLDAVYIGGKPAAVRYAGRSGCCAGVDQIVLDVPAGVSGCYVPLAAVTNGIPSNFTTISVANSGGSCDDPLNFRASDFAALERNGRLQIGAVELIYWKPQNTVDLFGNFGWYGPDTITTAPPGNPSPGSCYQSQFFTVSFGSPGQGNALYAGGRFTVAGPGISITAELLAGQFYGTGQVSPLPAGTYNISGPGGGSVGPLSGNFPVTAPVQWTNSPDYLGHAQFLGQPMTFKWTGGSNSTFTSISVGSGQSGLGTSVHCVVPASSGVFTVPDYVTRALLPGPANIEVGSFDLPSPFQASGLDLATVTVVQYTTVDGSLQRAPVSSQGIMNAIVPQGKDR